MVSPKKVCCNNGDKSPSPEPFKEPEGLVTIDLRGSKIEEVQKSSTQTKKTRKRVVEVILALFIFNITVFGIILYINEESYFFKAKPLVVKESIPGKENNVITINNLINKCVDTKPLKICCILFGDTDSDFYKYCLDNSVVLSAFQIDKRKKRDLTSQIYSDYQPPFAPIYDYPQDYFYESDYPYDLPPHEVHPYANTNEEKYMEQPYAEMPSPGYSIKVGIHHEEAVPRPVSKPLQPKFDSKPIPIPLSLDQFEENDNKNEVKPPIINTRILPNQDSKSTNDKIPPNTQITDDTSHLITTINPIKNVPLIISDRFKDTTSDPKEPTENSLNINDRFESISSNPTNDKEVTNESGNSGDLVTQPNDSLDKTDKPENMEKFINPLNANPEELNESSSIKSDSADNKDSNVSKTEEILPITSEKSTKVFDENSGHPTEPSSKIVEEDSLHISDIPEESGTTRIVPVSSIITETNEPVLQTSTSASTTSTSTTSTSTTSTSSTTTSTVSNSLLPENLSDGQTEPSILKEANHLDDLLTATEKAENTINIPDTPEISEGVSDSAFDYTSSAPVEKSTETQSVTTNKVEKQFEIPSKSEKNNNKPPQTDQLDKETRPEDANNNSPTTPINIEQNIVSSILSPQLSEDLATKSNNKEGQNYPIHSHKTEVDDETKKVETSTETNTQSDNSKDSVNNSQDVSELENTLVHSTEHSLTEVPSRMETENSETPTIRGQSKQDNSIQNNEINPNNYKNKEKTSTVSDNEGDQQWDNGGNEMKSEKDTLLGSPEMKSSNQDILSIDIPLEDNSEKVNSHIAKSSDNIDSRTRQKIDLTSASLDLQSNRQTSYNPCLNMQNSYAYANDPQQVLRIVPKSSPYIINPPIYPYVQSPFMLPQQFINQQFTNGPLQVSGPGGQFYICNPISGPNMNPANSNNVAGLPGVEVRRESANLQELVGNVQHLENSYNRSGSNEIECPTGYFACEDGSKCLPKFHLCDSEVNCDDASDETFCTCRERVGKFRQCDGYQDCPQGDDELGCFGCSEDEFSCDDWSKSRKSTCIPMEERCDNKIQCQITGKDEEDCSILTDKIGPQPVNKISNAVGFLHRNYKGKWFPTCYGDHDWSMDVCKIEAGPTAMLPKTHMMLTTNQYDGYFVNSLPNEDISLVKNCIQDRATFVECPPMYCGMRVTIRNPYRKNEVDVSAENIIEDLERAAPQEYVEELVGDSRIVGGKPSQPAAWPWLVSIYKNGNFHCGGVLINEWWIVTATHCVDKYWQFYYEIQAGSLRRFSYAPMEQHRWASVVIPNRNYDRTTLKHDIALMKLSSPVRFNRYIRPVCLPTEFTAGRDFMAGPSPGTICTTIGWGATMEHGADPDHVREVQVPIEKCTHKDDLGDEDICAGLAEGGKDACQGDSGGPLLCRNPNNPNQWYLAGVVSHGEGCARPNEPGVYTNVAKYVGWLAENMDETKFIARFPLQKCPGYECKLTNRCVPKKRVCDRVVDCLLADDEINCHSPSNHLLSITRTSNNEENDPILQATLSNTKANSSAHEGANKYFTCKKLLQLVPSSKRCDKTLDCEDGSDEEDCKCADYVKHQNPNAICDGITDCHDASDENCLTCNSDQYFCNQTQKCIDLTQRCNGVADCDKSEDEWDCVALTDGKSVTFDIAGRPNLILSGVLTINKNGKWQTLCHNTSEQAAAVASNACYMIGFEDYVGFEERQEDAPFNVPSKENETCTSLYVRCSNVSLDNPMRNKHLDNVTEEIELYTSPWNAVIYADGAYKCMGAVLNSRWIVTSVGCFDGITNLRDHYVVVLLGKGKAALRVKGPHEQTLRIVESVEILGTDIILLRTEKYIEFTRYVKDVRLNIRRDGRRRENCVAIGVYNNKAKYVFLNPIENCEPGLRCFETKLKENCTDSNPWSGNVFCDSGNGWYTAAVFSEKKGLCGLSSVLQYTSLPFNKNRIFKAMEKFSPDAPRPECMGFRCALGECIPNNLTCNGIEDCVGGEDEHPTLCYENERACHLYGQCSCRHSELKCNDGKCIPKSAFCDMTNDCGDFSDEPPVCNCREYLKLTDPRKLCDGVIHCLDRSDESPESCPCPSDGFHCISTKHCIINEMVCDGFEDCPNGEDEKTCLDIVNEKNESTNAGELKRRTAGVWHSGCFNETYTKEELNTICMDLGYNRDGTDLLPAMAKQPGSTSLRPEFDDYQVVWIYRKGKSRFNLALRSGNEPYVRFVPDENCH
ncbi:unnamed protein product, partial [Phyllotreta striolata]